MTKKLLVNKRGTLLTLAGLVAAGAAFVAPFEEVFASSATLSVSSGSVNVGDSFTATVNMTDAAAWNIHVTASGPVEGCTIAVADATDNAMNASRSFGANCTATGEGTITLTLSGDITGEDMSNTPLSGSASVSVSAPAPQPEQPSSESGSDSESSAGNGESDSGSAGGETSSDSGGSSDSSNASKTDSEASNSNNESKASSSTKATGTDKKNLTRVAENTKVGDDNSQDEQPNLIWIPFACVGGMIVLIGIGFGIYYFINKRSLKKPLNRGGRK